MDKKTHKHFKIPKKVKSKPWTREHLNIKASDKKGQK